MTEIIPDELHPARIIELCGEGRFGTTMIFLRSVDSTNIVAASMAAGLPEGSIILAGRQTAGRGRKGRDWYSSTDGSLVLSIILKPQSDPVTLTALLALSVVEAIEAEAPEVAVDIKWPNDIYSGGRKLAGILAERSGENVVLGIGLDVNDDAGDFPPEISKSAVSMKILAGRSFDRGLLLVSLLRFFEKNYMRWENEGFSIFRFDLENRLLWKGMEVSLDSGSEVVTGSLEGLTDEGFVRISSDGRERIFSSGDLTLTGRADSSGNGG
ncbi:MAG: biotin--[acetyl-CoA-carboxylase] ligase [Candidatus Krumholzibacteria bacterium]|nr:biotin--[acetyl-CoA-carboxylase] ligase [Candidatus Krumholzibacteria bacterium]